MSRMVFFKTHGMICESYDVLCTTLENKMSHSQQYLLSCMTTSWSYCWHVKVSRKDFGYQAPLVIGRIIPGWHENVLGENRVRAIIPPTTQHVSFERSSIAETPCGQALP